MSNKIKIPNDKFDINLKFYFFLKYLLKAKLNDAQSCEILITYSNSISKTFDDIKLTINQYIFKNIKDRSDK